MNENSKRTPEGEFSAFSLEAWLCGQVRPELHQEVSVWLQADERARKQLADLQDSNRQILEKYPADWMAEALSSRLRAEPPPQRRLRNPGRLAWLALPAAAALLLVLLRDPARPRPGVGQHPGGESILIKGGPMAADLTGTLQVHRRNRDGVEVLHDGSEVRPGELLQLSCWLSRDAYGLIISIDGLGNVTQHFPLTGEGNLIRGRKRTLLPYAIELDQAPRFERFYLIIAAEPFVAPELLARIKGRLPGAAGRPLPRLDLPPGFAQTALTLIKKTLTEGRHPNRMDKS